ncbi:MAG: phage integrase SAM-like domain-containing protein [Bizionia sp.]|nr:phage integrase SAM-like domain-containing protein [Bizionia sp.]
MAVVYFVYRSTKEKAALKVRLQLSDKKSQFEASTQIHTSKTYWNTDRKKQRNLTAEIKNENKEISPKLDALQNYILKRYENELPQPTQKEWLKNIVAEYYTPLKENIKRSDLVIDCIKYIIETANIRENNQKKLGLSKSRINSYKNLSKIIERYQTKTNPLRVKDVNIKLGKHFLSWLINTENYSESYARKKVDDLKAVCNDAKIDGMETSIQLSKIKGGKVENENIIYLTPAELEKIKNTTLHSEALINARKWLLFGCCIGQRGNDLLKINDSNFVTRNGLEVIELKQQKTGKNVTIPILHETKELLKDGLPKPITIQRFNDYIKIVCELSGITEPTKGSKIMMLDKDGKEVQKDKNGKSLVKGIKRTVKGIYPKYELISSHVCRRSFASNQYGILPTTLIMQVTAHSTEKMLLNYIGKTSLDYAQQIADFYTLQAQKQKKEPQLTVIKNAANQ